MKYTYIVLLLILNIDYCYSQTSYMSSLDGNDDYILMGDVNDLGTSDFTIEAWFYGESFGSGAKIISKGETSVGTPSNAGYGIRVGYFAPTQLDANIHGNGGNFYHLYYDNVQVNTWYHVALVREGEKLMLYVNCVLSSSITIPVDLDLDTDMPFSVGAIDKGGLSFNDHFFDGNIDEVRIWNVARDSEQLCKWKDCTINSPTQGLISVYNMDHSSGTIATDNSGNGNDGVCQSGATWFPSSILTSCFLSPGNAMEEIESIIYAYPNPANNMLYLYGLTMNSRIEIFDLSGRQLFEGSLNVGESIEISHFETGTYLIKVKLDTGFKVLRFVKD